MEEAIAPAHDEVQFQAKSRASWRHHCLRHANIPRKLSRSGGELLTSNRHCGPLVVPSLRIFWLRQRSFSHISYIS